MTIRLAVVSFFAACTCLFAQPPQPPPVPAGGAQAVAGESTSLTIYSAARPGGVPPEMYQPGMLENMYGIHWRQQIPGYAIVRQDRPIKLDAGRTTIRFRDVAAMIDPTTVSFTSLTDPATHVLEQSFEYDLVSTQKLMERFLDREITIEQSVGDKIETYTGQLLSAQGGLVLKLADGGVRVINGYSNVRFPELPGGLLTKPTLVWEVVTDKPGEHKTRVAYETKGITWWADYNVVFAEGKDANSGLLDIGAWVSVLNQSGGTYNDAKLKLIAGDVNRAPQPQAMPQEMKFRRGMAAAEVAGDAGFEEKAFFEYHLYTLGRPATIPDRSTKQIELFPAARQVPCEKVMVYYGQEHRFPYYGSPMVDREFGVQSNTKVDTYLQFKNAKDIGMGMPLPSGRIRVSKLDTADGSLEFIGEDAIDHTPKDEKVLIKLGSAFDVVGERRQTDFKVDNNRDRMEETVEIKIRNHKEEKVKVIVKENLYRWTNWEITQKTHDFDKFDSRTIHFPIEVDKDGEVIIRYTVLYTW